MAFGYVVVDDDYNVKKVIGNEEFRKYMTVPDVEKYQEGDKYPKRDDDDYNVAEVKFVNGINDKYYVFRDYDCAEAGDYVLVDTMYGTQVAKVNGVYAKDKWNGITPTKDIISVLPDYDEYLEREEARKKEARKKTDEIKRKLEKQNKEDNVIRIKLDEEEKDKFVKLIESMFNDWPSILS